MACSPCSLLPMLDLLECQYRRVPYVIPVDEAGSGRSISITVRARASTKMTLRYGGKAISRHRGLVGNDHARARLRSDPVAKPKTLTRRKLKDRRLECCSARLDALDKNTLDRSGGLLGPR